MRFTLSGRADRILSAVRAAKRNKKITKAEALNGRLTTVKPR